MKKKQKGWLKTGKWNWQDLVLKDEFVFQPANHKGLRNTNIPCID